MNRVIIGLGSNINPGRNISKAKKLLAEKFRLLKESRVLTTKPVGITDQADFHNGAVLIETPLTRTKLKAELKKIEKALGRQPSKFKSGPRTIDLDIQVWNNRIVDKDFHERDFLRKTVQELLPELQD